MAELQSIRRNVANAKHSIPARRFLPAGLGVVRILADRLGFANSEIAALQR